MMNASVLHRHVQDASLQYPFFDIYGRGPMFLILVLGKKLKYLFDFLIPRVRRDVVRRPLELAMLEEDAMWNLYALGVGLYDSAQYVECIEVMRLQLELSTARWRVDPEHEEMARIGW